MEETFEEAIEGLQADTRTKKTLKWTPVRVGFDLGAMLSAAVNSSCLTVIDLQNVWLNASMINDACRLRHVTDFSLRYNNGGRLDANYAVTLIRSFAERGILQKLDLSGSRCLDMANHGSYQAFIEGVKSINSLRELRMRDIYALGSSSERRLRGLWGFEPDDAELCKIEVLDISENDLCLTDSDCVGMSQFLARNLSLTYFIMRDKSMTWKHVKFLLMAFKTNRTMRRFEVFPISDRRNGPIDVSSIIRSMKNAFENSASIASFGRVQFNIPEEWSIYMSNATECARRFRDLLERFKPVIHTSLCSRVHLTTLAQLRRSTKTTCLALRNGTSMPQETCSRILYYAMSTEARMVPTVSQHAWEVIIAALDMRLRDRRQTRVLFKYRVMHECDKRAIKRAAENAGLKITHGIKKRSRRILMSMRRPEMGSYSTCRVVYGAAYEENEGFMTATKKLFEEVPRPNKYVAED